MSSIDDMIIKSINAIDPPDTVKERMLSNIKAKAEIQANTTVISKKSKALFSIKKAIAAAAVFAAVLFSAAIIIPLSIKNTENTDNLHGLEILDVPQHVESFIAPELEQLYEMKPYSELLPNIIPAGLSFKSSFLTTYDEISNPDDIKFLSVTFESEDSNFEIKVSEYDNNGLFADPEKPETYKLSLYYGPVENEEAVGAGLPNVFRIIRSEDIRRDIASERIYTFKDGICKAEIDVLCGDHIVSYNYNGKKISADLFFDCITSSLFFDRAGSE